MTSEQPQNQPAPQTAPQTASQTIRIAVLDDYQGVLRAMADWEQLGKQAEVHFFRRHLGSGAGLIEALSGFDVIVATRERTPLPATVVDALPGLRLIVSTGGQNRSIDLAACKRRGIPVARAMGAPIARGATSELAWALILAIFKRLPQQQAALRAGNWQTDLTETLAGKVLGVVGLGSLGQSLARVGLAFGMDVVAWSPNLTDERAAAAGVQRVDKATLFGCSDVVSLHMALAPATAGMVGRDELQSMKRSACLINTSRDGLIAEGALIEALDQGWIASAGLDVFPVEPMPADHPLCRYVNVVMTPHLGYVNVENFRVVYPNVVRQIRAWMAGEPIEALSAS